MKSEDVGPDKVDRIVEAAVDRADGGRDTFRPATVADRHTKRVRDDHAPNAALHSAIKAAAEDDDRIHSVNLMGSHAPGEKDHEPRYHVRVTFENDAMGEPSTGPTFIGRLMERGKVRCLKAYGGARYDDVDVNPGLSAEEAASKTIHDAVDYVTVHLRPIEARVEPIEVPVRSVPDDVVGVSEDTVAAFLGDVDTRLHEELRSVAPLRVFRDVMRDYEHALPDPDRDGAGDRLQSLDVRLDDFPDGWRDEAVGPSAPIGLVESLEDLAAEYDKTAKNYGEDRGAPYRRAASDIRVALDDHVPGDTVDAPCGCGDYSVAFPSGDVPESFGVVCPECGNHFGQGAAPDEPCPCDHDHDVDDWDSIPRTHIVTALRALADRIADTVTDDDPEDYALGKGKAAKMVRGYADAVDEGDDYRTAHYAAIRPEEVEPGDHEFDFDEPETMAEATASGLGLAMAAESVARHGDGDGAARDEVGISDDTIDKAIDRGVVIERDGVLYDTRDVVRKVQSVERSTDRPAATKATLYVCHGCERKTLPDDFVTHDGVDGPACPRCGTAVDWDTTHADQVGADE